METVTNPEGFEAWVVFVLALILSLKVFAGLIVNLTETPKDNEAYRKFYIWIERVNGMFTKKAKQEPQEK